MKNCHQFHWKKWRYIFPLSCALNRRKEYLIETRIRSTKNHTKNRSSQIVEEFPNKTTRNKLITCLSSPPRFCCWTGKSSQSSSPDGTRNPSVVHDIPRTVLFDPTVSALGAVVSSDITLYNSPIKPQILTTDRFRSKPFTKQALEDKKCTVDRKVPKFIRSGIPSIRARIRDYPRQSSLYVDLKWKYPLIKDRRKKYCILCIDADVHSSWLIQTLTKQRVFCLVDRTYCTALRWSNNWCFIQNHQCLNDSFATAKSSLHYYQKVLQ